MFYRAIRLYQLYDFSAQSSGTGSAAGFFPVLSARLSRWVEPGTSQFIHQVVKF